MSDKPQIEVVVGVLIYNFNNEIFLAKMRKWKDKWTVPGGHVEYGERIVDCIKRETLEETGLEITDVEFVSLQEGIHPPEFHNPRHFIFLDYCAKLVGGEVKLNDELQEYQWINPRDALELDLNASSKIFIRNFLKLKNS